MAKVQTIRIQKSTLQMLKFINAYTDETYDNAISRLAVAELKGLREMNDNETNPLERPKIVCLCGSTRFSEAYQQANLEETLAGHIVLTIGADLKSDNELFAGMSSEYLEVLKVKLDWLHQRKIDLADEILVLNVDGYIGDSTRQEIEYAKENGKHIRWLVET